MRSLKTADGCENGKDGRAQKTECGNAACQNDRDFGRPGLDARSSRSLGQKDGVNGCHRKPDLNDGAGGGEKYGVDAQARLGEDAHSSGSDEVAPFRNEEGGTANGSEHAKSKKGAREGGRPSSAAEIPQIVACKFGRSGRSEILKRLEGQQTGQDLKTGIYQEASPRSCAGTGKADACDAGIVETAPDNELFEFVMAEHAQKCSCKKQERSERQHDGAHDGHRIPPIKPSPCEGESSGL